MPRHLRQQLLSEHHSSPMGGHFAAKKMYGVLMHHWWWDGMHSDTQKFISNCPQCAVVTSGRCHHRPPLHPIPVSQPFQIIAVDVMELPKTDRGNQYDLVFQDFLTKWTLACPMPDQKSQRIAEFLINEVIPLFGVPEALLSNRGTNLLSHLMYNICTLLGISKLNATAYHPQCDGMVEHFNRTLKAMLRKHAVFFCLVVYYIFSLTYHCKTGDFWLFLQEKILCLPSKSGVKRHPSSASHFSGISRMYESIGASSTPDENCSVSHRTEFKPGAL